VIRITQLLSIRTEPQRTRSARRWKPGGSASGR